VPSALHFWSSWESLDVDWVASLEKNERPAFFSSACLLQYNDLFQCFCTIASLMTFRTSSYFSGFILSVFNHRALYTRRYKKWYTNNNYYSIIYLPNCLLDDAVICLHVVKVETTLVDICVGYLLIVMRITNNDFPLCKSYTTPIHSLLWFSLRRMRVGGHQGLIMFTGNVWLLSACTRRAVSDSMRTRTHLDIHTVHEADSTMLNSVTVSILTLFIRCYNSLR